MFLEHGAYVNEDQYGKTPLYIGTHPTPQDQAQTRALRMMLLLMMMIMLLVVVNFLKLSLFSCMLALHVLVPIGIKKTL